MELWESEQGKRMTVFMKITLADAERMIRGKEEFSCRELLSWQDMIMASPKGNGELGG